MPKTVDETHAKKQAFLEAFGEHLTVTAAVKAVDGISRATAYRWKKEDATFREAWDELDSEITENLEREAYRRAVEGTDKPVFHRGEKVGDIRQYSDRLLEMLLRARAPEKYRDRISIEDETEAAKRRELEGLSDADLDKRLDGLDEGDNVIPIRKGA